MEQRKSSTPVVEEFDDEVESDEIEDEIIDLDEIKGGDEGGTSPKELATKLGIDPRSLRKFLRDHFPKDEHPGQGGRWSLTDDQAVEVESKYAAWVDAKPAKEAKEKVASNGGRSKKQAAAPVEEDDVEDFESLEDPSEGLEDLDFEDIED